MYARTRTLDLGEDIDPVMEPAGWEPLTLPWWWIRQAKKSRQIRVTKLFLALSVHTHNTPDDNNANGTQTGCKPRSGFVS